MPRWLGRLLCWLGYHVGGPEKTCAIVDPEHHRYLWCLQVQCVRCKKRLKLRMTGTKTHYRDRR